MFYYCETYDVEEKDAIVIDKIDYVTIANGK
jgi:hypothetical protein